MFIIIILYYSGNIPYKSGLYQLCKLLSDLQKPGAFKYCKDIYELACDFFEMEPRDCYSIQLPRIFNRPEWDDGFVDKLMREKRIQLNNKRKKISNENNRDFDDNVIDGSFGEEFSNSGHIEFSTIVLYYSYTNR